MRRLLGSALLLILFFRASSALSQPSAAKVAPQPSGRPELVLLDTDIGDDIDDAFALGLALRSPELELAGVTTAFGNTELRARLVERYLDAVGKPEIPVYAGIATKTDNPFTQAAYARRADAAHRGDGVQFLLDFIRTHPDQITLLAIGPLINVQAAIERDPAAFRKLKRVVLMGGSVERGYDGASGEHRPPEPEWNVSRDPAGLRALLGSGVPVYAMPLDSTQIHLPQADLDRLLAHGSPLTDQLALLYHQWSANADGHPRTPTLFDPVAVAYAIDPALCPMTPMHLEVDEKGNTLRTAGAPNAQVCLKADEAGFLRLLLDRLEERSGGSSKTRPAVSRQQAP